MNHQIESHGRKEDLHLLPGVYAPGAEHHLLMPGVSGEHDVFIALTVSGVVIIIAIIHSIN